MTTRDAQPLPTDAQLRRALAGVRGLLIDIDGVIVLKGRLVPGAQEALAELEGRQIPYLLLTNTSLVSRATLSDHFARAGITIAAGRIISCLSASAAHTRRRFAGQPLFVLATADALREFEGQWLMSPDEADQPDARAAAVVIGDASEGATWQNLNRAFRLIHRGARLIGMHKNRWWLTPEGPTLDSGAIVAGLEYSTGQRALILGKPSPALYREAASELLELLPPPSAHGSGRSRPSRAELAMVGDDVWNDALAAQRVGLRGVFVLSGKHGPAELREAAQRPRGGGKPDAIAASLSEVVRALD